MMTSPEVQRRGGSRSRGALTRDRVLTEALALLDRDGLDALTMRRLAAHLGVSPMALYNHVGGKQDLLRGVAQTLLAQATFAIDHPDWRERIRACFRELRRLCLASPAAIPLMEAADVAPLAVFRPMEVTLAALEEIPLDRADALRAYFLLVNFTLGQVSYEIRGPFNALDPGAARRGRRLHQAGLGHVERAAPGDGWDFERAFEFGLSVILAGLERPAVA